MGMKMRLNSSNACHHSAQTFLSSRLLSKNVKIKIYRTIIFPVVLYGCKIWSLTLREEHRLRVFENRVLKRIFGPKRDEMTGDWRKLRKEELHNLYSSPNIIIMLKSMRMGCNTNEEKRDTYIILVGKPKGKKSLGRPRHRWVDDIEIYPREVEWDSMD
jgi:hypothetical protein